jgi:starch synthase
MFIMPSRYEPCGLNQVYSLRYGTVPIVRATGGLDDTILDYDMKTGSGNGFKFQPYSAAELLKTVQRALAVYEDKKQWKKLMINCMSGDFSWEKSARKYIKLYRTALRKKKKGLI